jgi:hypothetical protein
MHIAPQDLELTESCFCVRTDLARSEETLNEKGYKYVWKRFGGDNIEKSHPVATPKPH